MQASGPHPHTPQHHCDFWAMSSITGFHFRCSPTTKEMTSAGDIARVYLPRAAIFLWRSGSVTTLRRSLLAFLIMLSGVPIGATRTCQPVAEKSGIMSATVGTLGNSARGFSEATAMALTEPDSTAPAIPEYPSIINATRPLTTSLIACAGPPV